MHTFPEFSRDFVAESSAKYLYGQLARWKWRK